MGFTQEVALSKQITVPCQGANGEVVINPNGNHSGEVRCLPGTFAGVAPTIGGQRQEDPLTLFLTDLNPQ